MGTTTRTLTIPAQVNPTDLLGPVDEVLKVVEANFPDLTFVARGNTVRILSHSAATEPSALEAETFLADLIETAQSGTPMGSDDVSRLLSDRKGSIAGLRRSVTTPQTDRTASKPVLVPASQNEPGSSLPRVITFALGVPVRPKTAGQIDYVKRIDTNVITFGIGPAGTGKTYLAVAKAVQAFENRQVRRIILTRPAVEAGENLGFLPGTLSEKIDPYLRPLYDALSDMIGPSQLKRYMADGTIEVAPLAYMRGRTLNDAFVILDEAQNTTEQQMKMFLTRLGFNTTMVVTGDVTQVDLGVTRSGLASIESILGELDTIAFVHLSDKDVVRHSLVGKIVKAYDEHFDELAVKRAQRREQGSKSKS